MVLGKISTTAVREGISMMSEESIIKTKQALVMENLCLFDKVMDS